MPLTLPGMAGGISLFAFVLLAALFSTVALGGPSMLNPNDFLVGGYGKGVSESSITSDSLAEPRLRAEVAGASFIAFHPTLPVIYCVSESLNGVLALKREGDGSFKEIARGSSGGAGPCHLSVHPSGKAVFVANYGDGKVAMLTLKQDGTFLGEPSVDQHEGTGPVEKRQEHAHAHSIYPHPDGTHVLSADLGCDAIFVYRVDLERGRLTDKHAFPIDPGSGPRHLAFSKDGKLVYCVNELSNTVSVLRWDADRESLKVVQTISTRMEPSDGTSFCAEIRIHPTGKFLYASNRGDDSIAVFTVDSETGALTRVANVSTGGQWPRGFEVNPTGRFLIVANQRSNLLTMFRIDEQTGVPSATGATVPVEKPACVRFAASPP